MEQMTSICDMVGQYMQKKEEDRRVAEDQAAKDRYWKIPICYNNNEDDTIAVVPVLSTEEPIDSLIIEDEHLDTILETESNEDYTIATTPVLSTKEPIDSLIMEDEHLDTIPATESDESTSSDDDYPSVRIIVIRMLPPHDCWEIVTISGGGRGLSRMYNPTPSSDVMTKSSSTSLNLFLEETNTFDNSLPESETFCFNLEEISSGSTTTRSDYSLPDYEAFYDHIEEKSSGSTTTHADFSQYDSFIFDLLINLFPPADRSDFYHEEFADELAHIISPPEYDCFYFKNEPELGEFSMDVVGEFFPTREPRVHVPNILPTHPTHHLDLNFIISSDSLFAYVVWIFLSFLTYLVSPPYLLSCGNEDTIFDPDISIYHSFMPGISHRSGTFMKFNVYPNHLNE
ncbi:hypothetical protein Tco_0810558 [Tanacetum coccineum]